MVELRKRSLTVDKDIEKNEIDKDCYDDEEDFGKMLGNKIDEYEKYQYKIILKVIISIVTFLALLSSDTGFFKTCGWMISICLLLFMDEITQLAVRLF